MIEEKEELQGQLIASGQVVASMVSQKGAKGEKGDPGEPGSPGVPGTPGQDGFSPIASISKVGKIATITITDSQGTTTAEIRDGEDGQGSGDMLKSTYDTNNNGIVDNAEKVNNHTVESDVPANAVFTDTTYTAGTNVSISAENVISATDTTYTAGTGIDITNGVITNTQTSAEWGNITGTLSDQTDLKSVLDAKGTYSKPSGGIPDTDLTSAVQTSLGKADTAIQSSDLATVATTGDYDDLIDKPTIPPEMSILSYGSSTWNDFITAYTTNSVVYCKTGTGNNPASSPLSRMAILTYVRIENDEITYVEFQYYRSIGSHTSSQQGDQVFVYTLDKTNGWSFETREAASKIVAGTNMSSTYSNGTLTLNAEGASIPTTLYNNPSGTASTISNLSDDVENYDYIEIYFKTNDTGSAGSTKIISSTSGTKVATLFYIWFVGNTDYVKSATINISQKTISFKSNVQYQNFGQRESGSFVYITKVVGYK